MFYSKIFQRKNGAIMAVRFSNTDPNFFVVLGLHAVIFYRIDLET